MTEMKNTGMIRETLGGIIAYKRPRYMVRDERDDKHSYTLDTDGFTVSIEISVSDTDDWKTADAIMENADVFREKVEDQFPDCLAAEPEKLAAESGIEEVIVDYSFQDNYEGQDYEAVGAIVYIPVGDKLAQASFMYLDFSDNGRNYESAYHDFLDMICSVEMLGFGRRMP